MFRFALTALLALGLAGCASIGMAPPAAAAEAPLVLAEATPPKRPVISLPTPPDVKDVARLVAAELPAYTLPQAQAPIVHVSPPNVHIPAPVVHVAAPEAAEATAGSIAINYGGWLIQVLTFLGGFAYTLSRLATGLIGNPVIRMVVEAYLTETKIKELVNLAIAKTAGLAPGMVVQVPVGNQLAAEVGQMAVDTLPGLMVDLLGGEEGIRQKAIAMLNLEASSSAETLGLVS